VELQGVASFDPQGDGEEHSERVRDATDGDAATYWTTERYNSFSKPGVGLVLDAGAATQLSQIAVTTDTPGFTAEIRAGDSPQGPFDTVVGPSRTVSDSTTWDLDGPKLQYYVIWITQLDRVAHVNEVKAN
jgi:putative peptidoglycan lipid II flippase